MRLFGSVLVILAGLAVANAECLWGSFRGVGSDCTKFEKCDHNEWKRFSCAAGTNWDWRNNVCNFASAVDCTSECSTYPCQNGGTCSPAKSVGFMCDCPAGTSGTNCQIRDSSDVNGQCQFSQCQNGGTCYATSSQTGYTCQCLVGYTGLNCQSRIGSTGSQCQFSQCQNGGTCYATSSFSGYTCQCPFGYTGVNCESASGIFGTVCSNQCQNGGTCLMEGTGYQCVCQLGYTGANCQEYLGQCNYQEKRVVASDCSKYLLCTRFRLYETYRCPAGSGFNPTTLACDSNYVCQSDPGTGQGPCSVEGQRMAAQRDCSLFMACKNGYWEAYRCPAGSQYNPVWSMCQMQYTCIGNNMPCSRNPCYNGGTCTDQGTTGYYCTCPLGYSGNDCQIAASTPCSNRPCSNGGTCVVQGSSYICACPQGFSGFQCQSRMFPCESNPCFNGGACRNQGFGYICTCQSGYSGTQCQLQSLPCNNNPCLNGGACTNQGGASYTCTCPQGYSGFQCQIRLQDSCSAQPCLNGGVCTNQGNGYYCTCPQRYSGVRCQDSSDPAVPTGPCSVSDRYIADNTNCGQFYACYIGTWLKFRCPNDAPRYSSSAGTCVRIFETACGTSRLTTCANTHPLLYDNDAGCVGHYRCINSNFVREQCPSGTRFDRFAKQCTTTATCDTVISACSNNPCVNGVCSFTATGFTCTCSDGYTGTRCDVRNALPCDSVPCLNGGVCSNNGASYTCTCNAGYTGTRCETLSLPCDNSPCVNGGVCNNNGNTFTCTCPTGYTGSRCESTSQPCDASPCQNNGVCENVGTSYTCYCSSLYSGQNCETYMSACENNPCNSGNCTAVTSTVYTCSCPPGKSGTTCQLDCAYPCPVGIQMIFPDLTNRRNFAACFQGAVVYRTCPAGFFSATLNDCI